MKKIICILLCCILLAGCSHPAAPQTTAPVPPETQPPTQPPTQASTEPPVTTVPPETEPPAPETVSATALADHTVLILTTANRGDVVEIAGEFDENHYVIKLENGFGLIEKNLVRLEGEELYTQWEGYAYYGAKMYDNYHLLLENVQDLGINTKILVLDSVGDMYVVQVGDVIGYMPVKSISKNWINTENSGADGGDIELSYHGTVERLNVFVPQIGSVTGSATVLVNDAEIMLGWYDRGDNLDVIAEAGVVEEKEGYLPVYAEGFCGYVRQNLVKLAEDEPFAEWSGYARSGALVYANYYLAGEAVIKPAANTVVQVLCDLGNCYLVQIGETTGYMEKTQVSESWINYSGGGDWSDPVM